MNNYYIPNNMDEVAETTEDSLKKEMTAMMKNEAIDIAVDIADTFLGGIPFVGTITKIRKICTTYNSVRLENKFKRLITNTQDIPGDEKRKLLDELTKMTGEDASITLLDILERLDHIGKVDVLTNLVKAKVRGELSLNNFMRLSKVLERIPYTDLFELEKYAQDDYYEPGSTESLLSTGVLLNTVIGNEEKEGETNKYRLNALGALMLNHGLENGMEVITKNTTFLLGVPTKPMSKEDIDGLFRASSFPEDEPAEL